MPLAFVFLLCALQVPAPRDAEDERATFHLPDGFSIELVAAEPQVKKIVDIAFDDAGRMWATTASEYPRDGNEDPSAESIYDGHSHDQVLVFDHPWSGERLVPKVFADGLGMPMSVLPLPEGAIVQHGHEILLLSDTDGDGRADHREVLLSGFGTQDSHLMPHRFLRGPDGWIYMAQGAFNSSLVRDRSGHETRFDHCKLGRFTRDGKHFEIVASGLNNIWGIVFDRSGQFWIQEANDLGYCVVPLERDASYPGIGMQRVRPYSPWQPPLADFRMGGTGLSGLALSECDAGFPAPFDGILFLANPIERQVQTVRTTRDGAGWQLARGPDFITSDDQRFRPVAVHFGPDESLYIVDWYNPIISHNEVPRSHPDRDKIRTRVWRVRHKSMQRFEPRDMTTAWPFQLMESLASTRTWESRAAWHQIVDRKLGTGLGALALHSPAGVGERLLALWSLEELGILDAKLASVLLSDPDPAIRRETLSSFASPRATEETVLAITPCPADDVDPHVRAQWICTLDAIEQPSELTVAALLRCARPQIAGATIRCEQEGVFALTGEAHDRAFERFLVRKALERHAEVVRAALAAPQNEFPAEGRALAALAIDGEAGAGELCNALAQLTREPSGDELALLARFANDERVAEQLTHVLGAPAGARRAIEALLALPHVELNDTLRARIVAVLRESADGDLIARAATKLRLQELESDLARMLESETTPRAVALASLRALTALNSKRDELFNRLARAAVPGDEIQREALQALAACGTARSSALALAMLPDVPDALRRQAAETLALSKEGARALVEAASKREIDASSLDERTFERLRATLSQDEHLAKLLGSLAGASSNVLEFRGAAADYVDTNLDLDGAFTIEAWVQLDEPITNNDGLLALPNVFDLNFAGAKPRLWQGPQEGDVIIARKTVEAGRWTHVALTRAANGVLRLYLDGELDTEMPARPAKAFRELDVGRTTPGGTAGRFAEFRVWSIERAPGEIALERARTFDTERPATLRLRLPGDDVQLSGAAAIVATPDHPPLASAAELAAERALFARYNALAQRGKAEPGRAVFERTCQVCHSLGGRGESVGPPLDGSAQRGIDGLLAAVLRPSAAVEAGYRLLRVELADDTALEGLLVAQDDASLTLRPATNAGAQPPRRLARSEITRTRWSKLSVMPDGLLQSLADDEAANLLAFLLAQR
jgi:putative membrane-bound dehydrogenase-like protein